MEDTDKTTAELVEELQELRREEASLREKEVFLQAIYEHSQIGVFVVDVLEDGSYRYVGINPAQERITGVKNEDLVGKAPCDLEPLIGAEAVDYIMRYYDECVEKRETLESENFLDIEGKGDWWFSRLIPLADAAGKVYRLVGSGITITERKQVEEGVRANERRLADSQRAAKVGNYEWDLFTSEVTWSAEMYRIFEVGEDYMPTTEGFAEFVHPDDIHFLSEGSFQQALSEKYHEMEFRVVGVGTRAVKTIHLWGEVVANAEGIPIRIYGTLQDITAAKSAELALRASEERYRLLVDNASVCIHEIDLEGRLVSMNQTGLDMMEVADEASIYGMRYLDIVAAEDRQRIESLWDGALANQPSHFQFKVDSKGGPLFIDSSFIPIQGDEGHLVNIMGVLQDITVRRQMEEELRKKQNLESLGVLAGGIAHDFNNVLTAVIGGLGLLEMLLDKDSREYGIAQNSMMAAERTRDLTRQLLTFAKGGALVKGAASIEDLLKDTTELSLHGSNAKPEYHFGSHLHS
ncbi:MAG: PAS domain-containing protein [Candidatus Latescibacterota bacterium]|jgi:PAS domain S-box-containing protein